MGDRVKARSDISGTGREMASPSWKSPLASAVIDNDLAILESLLSSGADVHQFSYFRGHGEAPLLTAVRYARFDMVQALLKHGADVNQSSSRGHTPLLRAAQRNYFPMVCELLRHEADVSAVDTEGRDALFWAVKSRNLDAVKKLVEAGASLNSQSDNIHIRQSMLHLAAACTDIMGYLVAAGANVNALDDAGETPLFSSVRVDNYHNVLNLLENGAMVNAINQDHRTVLHLAAASVNNSLAVTKLLLEHGCFINPLDRYLSTPLVLTLRSYILQKNDSVIRCLIQHGSDLRYELCMNSMQYTMGSNMDLLNFAIVAGFRLNRASWVPGFLEDMKEDMRRGHFFDNDESCRQAVSFITKQLNSVHNLSALARVVIRERIIDVGPGVSIYRSIEKLPIPEPLKIYLKLTDI